MVDFKTRFPFPKIRTLFLLLFLLHAFVQQFSAQVRLPRLISDGMVLQRGANTDIWGWAAANEAVSVEFHDSTYRATADSAGNWRVRLASLQAGGPYGMVVRSSNTLFLQNILVGDVWVCSGQSNMDLPMRRVEPLYAKDIATANNPMIRYYYIDQQYDFQGPRADLDRGAWQMTDSLSVREFSATAYFFAAALYERYQVPIGLLKTSLGGSPAESWMSERALQQFPEHYREGLRFKDPALIRQIETSDKERRDAWYAKAYQLDSGYHSVAGRWLDPLVDTKGWKSINVPGYWSATELGPANGVVWFRKDVQLDANQAGKAARLNLGRIVDADSVYVNGRFVGSTGYQYPPRWYEVPAGVLKQGRNTIVIRVINESGLGGFVPDKPYELSTGDRTIGLKGPWQYRLGVALPPLEGPTAIRWKPGGLYNAMLAPLLNYRIKGAIWYQGESNTRRPVEYRSVFPAMIRDWRVHWGQGDFPFLFVQLANFMETRPEPSESNWAMLREAQQMALALPNTGMAVAIDLGEWNDIHPLRKKEVGQRLALAAQRVAYDDKNAVYSGPAYQSMRIDGNQAIVTFAHTGSGLVANDGKPLRQFAIAGQDGRFVWANAQIHENEVIVWSDEVPRPVAVRYAWADNPEGANLYNREGLPAAPFRTDGW